MKTTAGDIKRFLSATKIYRPGFNSPIWFALKNKRDIAARIDNVFCPDRNLDKYKLFINERILEIPFVHRMLDAKPGSRILDFGCTESKFSIELASRGMIVTGVDLRPYPYSVPNLTFMLGDFFDLELEEQSFDVVLAISAVEHVGLGAYGDRKLDQTSDQAMVGKFFRLLKPGGQLILTVPFGSFKVTPFYRIYDNQTLRKLLESYAVEHEEYFVRDDFSKWSPATATELSKKVWDPGGHGADGVALISARRPAQ
ncbi:MAG TPA: class I SAM-dependent methyltransferase [Anaerolineales bacterium]|jgi:2-polyprenyl-3-methyl-5-hydroxy-6-metoxy-1,4-benzoquinol methylase|nr:class I SAM-dependent methyltransferase [Anaerolineales bacterium]